MTAPLADPVEEGARLAERAGEVDVPVRLTGGVAVALTCESARREPLARRYGDLDLVGPSRERRRIVAFLSELGYRPDERFNALHGGTRLLAWDIANERQVDVFLDRVELCHTIDLRERISAAPRTLSPADLLLMKLQVVETNAKDFKDVLALLVDHDFTEGDEGINLPYLARLAASDWGLWRTTTMVAERAGAFAESLDGFTGRERVQGQVRRYLEALEEVPKTRSWRLRARIGERKRWYELPEEH